MMKLKQFLKNSIKLALLLVNLLVLTSGCFQIKKYPQFSNENIAKNIQDICKTEFNVDVVTKIAGQTLWVYLPLEDIIGDSQKEKKIKKRFQIEQVLAGFQDNSIKIDYAIKEEPPEEVKTPQIEYTKEAKNKISSTWRAIYRAVFKLKHSYDGGIQFVCFAIADIKNGFELKQIAYLPDFKKALYGVIQGNELHHRIVMEEPNINFSIIGDKKGLHLNYKDFNFKQFLAIQIQQRIIQKFQSPGLRKNINIDNEIRKTIAYVLKVYDFKDFSEVEFNNLFTNKNEVLRRAFLWNNILR